MNTKRVPKSKSGRLLVIVRDRIQDVLRKNIFDAASRAQARVVTTDDLFSLPEVKTIEKLSRRIAKRLEREDKKSFQQPSLFNSFDVTFLRPNRKRPVTQTVCATTKRKANALIKQRYGQKTKIIS